MNIFQLTVPSLQIISELQNLLEESIRIDKADMGNIQVFDKKTGTLNIIAQKGFKKEFLDHFKIVKAFDSSACGRAAGIGNIVAISDVMHDLGFAPHRSIAKNAGFRSVKSIPVLTADNNLLGIISTHFKNIQWSWQIELLSEQVKKISCVLENNSTAEFN